MTSQQLAGARRRLISRGYVRWEDDGNQPPTKGRADICFPREAFFRPFFEALPKLMEAKKTLREKGLTAGRMRCPWCGVKGACAIAIAPGNNHLRAHCTGCNRSMME